MAKLTRSNGLKKIDLEDIEVKSNSRKEFKNIDELAASIDRIKRLIHPIVVEEKPDGGYILTAGERRLRAHKLLVEQGKPYNQIDAIVINGNREIIQLVENVNRENLNALEAEEAIKNLLSLGMTQKEISEKTGKRISWVSDTLAAKTTRDKVNIDTSEISSSAMSLLRGLSKEELEKVILQVKKNGGTVKAVKAAIEKNSDPFDKIKKEALKLVKAGYSEEQIISKIREVLL